MDELNRKINSYNEDESEEEECPLDNERTEDIWKALEKGSLKGVKFCIAQDPSNLNKTDVVGNNFTPLHYASQKGHLEIAKYLLSKSAQVDPKDKWDQTPLFWACNSGHVSIANLLLDKGADIDNLNINRATPLHAAVSGNHLDVVKLLIQWGTDRTIKDKWGRTPLDLAISIKHSAIVNYLRFF